jgi:hypothetical protein
LKTQDCTRGREPRREIRHGNGADETLANGLAPVAGIYTQFATVTYTAGRKKHHVNPRPALLTPDFELLTRPPLSRIKNPCP